MLSNNLCFDQIDWGKLTDTTKSQSLDINCEQNKNVQYDDTTTETYRIKRLFKIDPLTDIEVKEEVAFKFYNKWDPYSGLIYELDPIGPLYFDAINLYNYYFLNRYKGLWIPPHDQFQGYYGDAVGTGKKIKIISRGIYPERYLFRLPIIDCYLQNDHKNSLVTMGPELSNDDIAQIDLIVMSKHPSRTLTNFVPLSTLKTYYDNALEMSPNQESNEIKNIISKFPNLNQIEINLKYNRYWVDKLVKIRY